jgi:hypothetical protein
MGKSDPISGRAIREVPIVVTHGGRAHLDETLGCHVLKYVLGEIEIQRTEDPDLMEAADYLLDTGKRYNPAAGQFDHHYPTRRLPSPPKDRRAPYATIGLIWDYYGRLYLRNILEDDRNNWEDLLAPLAPDTAQSLIDRVHSKVDYEIVTLVDAWDNGRIPKDTTVLPAQWLAAAMEFDDVVQFAGGAFRRRCWMLLTQYFDELRLLDDRVEGEDRYWMFGENLVILCPRRVETAAVKKLALRFEGARLLAHIGPTQRGGWVCMAQTPMPMALIQQYKVEANHNRTMLVSQNPEALVDMMREFTEGITEQ